MVDIEMYKTLPSLQPFFKRRYECGRYSTLNMKFGRMMIVCMHDFTLQCLPYFNTVNTQYSPPQNAIFARPGCGGGGGGGGGRERGVVVTKNVSR